MNSTYTLSVLIRISCAYLIILTFAFASTPQAIAGTLTVHNGSGSGSYSASTKVTIWANPQEDANPLSTTRAPLDANLSMRIFDRWIGDTAQIADVESPQTSVTMPASDINITAQYKDAPRWLDVITYFPNPHTGVIFMFHGMGGCAACLFDQTETRSFIEDATARGYAIVALDSYDRRTKAWNLETEPVKNPDLQRVAALRQALIVQGSISPADPIYLVGGSSGGFFASLFTQSNQDNLKFPVEATALYLSSGNWDSILSTSVPTIFIAGINDTLVPYNTVQKSYGLLLSMGIPTQLISSTPSRLYPERFWRIEGLSALDSQTIYDAIDNAGFLDGNGYLLSNPTTSGWEAFFPAIYESYKYQVRSQLNVAFAEHSVMGHLNKPVFDFFANPTTVINLEPSISEFAPASSPPNTQITITGNNFVDVQSVAIGGITARFTVISPTEIWAYVPANPMSGPITVTNSVSVATSASNFVVGSPMITSFTPSTGGSGTLVTITGDSLSNVEAVAFNGVTTSFSSLGSKTLTTTVPSGATTGPITVTTSQGTVVSETDMILFPSPAITAMAPSQGAIGTLITITGSHFTPTTSVKFSGIEANFTVVSDTQITSIVPVGTPTFSRITVITPSGYTSSPTYFRIK